MVNLIDLKFDTHIQLNLSPQRNLWDHDLCIILHTFTHSSAPYIWYHWKQIKLL